MEKDSNRDVAERSQASDTEGEDIYEIIVREMDDVVFLIDVEQTDGDYMFTLRRNSAPHQYRTGFSEGKVRGQTPREPLDDEQGATVAANCRRCVEQGDTIQYEETLELPAGTSHWRTKLTPITDNGTVTQVVGVARDITEQKERQQTVQRIDRRFEAILKTMSAAVFLKDIEGQYLLMNRACRELLGVEDDTVVGLTDDDLFPPEVAQKAKKDDQEVIENGKKIELEEEVPSAKGNTVRLTRKSPVYDDNSEIVGLCGVSTDITEQKQREQEINRLKERVELAVKGANLGVWDWDIPTDEVNYNEQWKRMLGYSPDEVESTFGEWERLVHPDDLDIAKEALDEHIAGETEMYDTEIRMQTADGDWKWIQTIGKIAEYEEGGEPIRAVGIHLDISDIRESRQALERQNERLEDFASIVSHDLRNPLQVAGGRLELISQECESDHIDDVAQALDRMDALIEDLLTLAREREQVKETEPVGLANVAKNSWQIVSTEQAALETNTSQVVKADQGRLQQLFENLYRNAVEHGGDDVTVSVGPMDGGFYVADTGPGIPESEREDVFEAGYSTNNEGTGFGLQIVEQVADAHGWEVTVTESEQGGAKFEIIGVERTAS